VQRIFSCGCLFIAVSNDDILWVFLERGKSVCLSVSLELELSLSEGRVSRRYKIIKNLSSALHPIRNEKTRYLFKYFFSTQPNFRLRHHWLLDCMSCPIANFFLPKTANSNSTMALRLFAARTSRRFTGRNTFARFLNTDNSSVTLNENIPAPPMTYIAGEEMTHYACNLFVEQWIQPYFDTSAWESYDLSCKARDEESASERFSKSQPSRLRQCK